MSHLTIFLTSPFAIEAQRSRQKCKGIAKCKVAQRQLIERRQKSFNAAQASMLLVVALALQRCNTAPCCRRATISGVG
jgi:hypothetical protein